MEVAPGTVRRMRELRDQCVVRIAGAEDDAADGVIGRLGTILHQVAGDDIAVAYVSEVISTPDGPMVLFDAKGLTDAELELALDMLVHDADDAGLTSGRIEVPDEGRLVHDLETVDRAVIGAALPPPHPTRVRPPGELPDAWRDVAADWLHETGRTPLVAEIVSVESSLHWDQLGAYLHSEATSGGFRVSCGSIAEGVRTVFESIATNTRLSFMATGSSMSSDEMLQEASAIRRCLRLLTTDLAYAYLTPTNSAGQFGMGELDLPGAPRAYPGGVNRSLMYLSNMQVLDAFWYQILGPGHLKRLGHLPEARPLGDGKVELVLGEFEDWLVPDKARRLRDQGRSLLAPCFFSKDEARVILNERRAARRHGMDGDGA